MLVSRPPAAWLTPSLVVLATACGAKTQVGDDLPARPVDAAARHDAGSGAVTSDSGREPPPDDPFPDEPLPPTFPPTEPPDPIAPTISAGHNHTCAVSRTGTVYCWGDNEADGLGFHSGGVDVPTPTEVPSVTNAVGVSLGISHGCALHADRSVTCWGANYAAQLGHGPAAGSGRSAPSRPPGPVVDLVPVTRIDAGGAFTCALPGDGELWCWGADARETGGGSIMLSPTSFPDLGTVTHLNAGDQHACVIDATRHVTCWGYSHQGTFGMNSSSTSRTAVPVPELTGAVQLAGDAVNCALLGDGTVSCCPLTDGVFILGESCERVPYLTGAVRIEASSGHVCAIVLDGTVWCWGWDNDGTISVKTEGLYVPRPIRAPGVEDAVELAAGYAHVCAKQRDGRVLCWGKNDAGQLGLGVVDSLTHAPTAIELTL